VATPTGVLDGVAVYTWSGSAWTPPGGQTTPSTPTGALRGVAAFNWDGAAWQPAGRAGPDVATPYGVLQGVAMFGWTGSAWAAVGAPSLSLDFMAPGALDPRITFTRASTATYTDSTGTIQTAAVNAPRWDYDPVTHALRGLLIEEARTNVCLQSGNITASPWAVFGTAITVTANNATAPDGALTATRFDFASVASGFTSIWVQGVTVTAAPYTFSVWLRGAVGGETTTLVVETGSTYYPSPVITLTAQWRRYNFSTPALTATTWYFCLGTDTRSGTPATPAQTIYAWGAQVEQGAFPTSYIPTTAAAVTRAQDNCVIPAANMAPWFASPGGSWFVEFIRLNPAPASVLVVALNANPGQATPFYTNATLSVAQFDGVAALASANTVTVGAITKGATSWAASAEKICANAGSVITGPSAGGYSSLGTFGVSFLNDAVSGQSENMTGYLRRVQYWPRALSDAEMQQVTT
jgi:hypothetical protein